MFWQQGFCHFAFFKALRNLALIHFSPRVADKDYYTLFMGEENRSVGYKVPKRHKGVGGGT